MYALSRHTRTDSWEGKDSEEYGVIYFIIKKHYMFIQSIDINKIGWNKSKEGEFIKYREKIKFSDWENETTRILTLCCIECIEGTADTFTDKIRNLIKPL